MDDVDYCLTGAKLYGDDFTQEQILAWYAAEEDGYASLKRGKPYAYDYHEMNRRCAWRYLPRRRFERALGLGSAFGHEFAPIIGQIGRLTLVDVSMDFQRNEFEGVPVDWVKAQPSGTLAVPDASFDLVVCLSVLHHIPNVTHVVNEIARRLAPGGYAILREPISSMGDWRKPRPGLTKYERGIPLHLFDAMINAAGFEVLQRRIINFGPWRQIWKKLNRRSRSNSKFAETVDEILATLFRWNYSYHAVSLFGKLRPSVAAFVLRRPLTGGG